MEMIKNLEYHTQNRCWTKTEMQKEIKYWILIRSQDFGNKKLQCVTSIKEESIGMM